MSDVPTSRRGSDFQGQDQAGLGVGAAVAGHGIAAVAASLVTARVRGDGAPDAAVINADWIVAFGAAEAVVFVICMAIAITAFVRDRTRFGTGILGGWVAGLILVGTCGAAQLVFG